jgi:hypothetical protein
MLNRAKTVKYGQNTFIKWGIVTKTHMFVSVPIQDLDYQCNTSIKL